MTKGKGLNWMGEKVTVGYRHVNRASMQTIMFPKLSPDFEETSDYRIV